MSPTDARSEAEKEVARRVKSLFDANPKLWGTEARLRVAVDLALENRQLREADEKCLRFLERAETAERERDESAHDALMYRSAWIRERETAEILLGLLREAEAALKRGIGVDREDGK